MDGIKLNNKKSDSASSNIMIEQILKQFILNHLLMHSIYLKCIPNQVSREVKDQKTKKGGMIPKMHTAQ